jgi:hypothetical protein
MEGDITVLSANELEVTLRELENTYADLLLDEKADTGTLGLVWARIREIRNELQRRQDPQKNKTL